MSETTRLAVQCITHDLDRDLMTMTKSQKAALSMPEWIAQVHQIEKDVAKRGGDNDEVTATASELSRAADWLDDFLLALRMLRYYANPHGEREEAIEQSVLKMLERFEDVLPPTVEDADLGEDLSTRQPCGHRSPGECSVICPAKPDPRGLFEKFRVSRVDGSDAIGGKHHGCDYFVLDLTHDKHAKAALRAYADDCRAERPALARDLDAKVKVGQFLHDDRIPVVDAEELANEVDEQIVGEDDGMVRTSVIVVVDENGRVYAGEDISDLMDRLRDDLCLDISDFIDDEAQHLAVSISKLPIVVRRPQSTGEADRAARVERPPR